MPLPGLPFEVFVDPFRTVTTTFGFVGPSGVRAVDFALPPLPPGTRLSMQAFEMLCTGEVLASNATNVGLW